MLLVIYTMLSFSYPPLGHGFAMYENSFLARVPISLSFARCRVDVLTTENFAQPVHADRPITVLFEEDVPYVFTKDMVAIVCELLRTLIKEPFFSSPD